MHFLKKSALFSALVIVGLTASSLAQARDLTVALRSEPTSMDPLFHALTSNLQLSQTIFDPLVRTDKDQKPVPALAESWEVDGDTWTFKLREGVKFSDGSPFTAEDVVFTYDRVPKVPNSPSLYSLYLGSVDSVKALDPMTVQITTKGPSPVLLPNLAQISIMSHTAASGDAPEGKTTTELNRGLGLVGTGPYRFGSWKRGSEIVFERNDAYWGDAPEWDKIVYRPISNPAARVASLLSGDVDLIEDVPTSDLERLKKDKKLHIQETPSLRIIYVAFNQGEEAPKGMSGTDGKNPLTDKRVREALTLALDRNAISARIMGGAAQPANNLLPYPGFGASESLAEVPAANIEKAKQLLAEAGYPNGFTLSLGSPDGRYTNDKDIAQAIAAMWARIGIKTDVETMAPSVFFQRRNKFDFSTYLAGWAASTGEMINPLDALIATRDNEGGRGSTNYSHYSNPELDELVQQASQTMDDDERRQLLEKAGELIMADYAILPLHFEMSNWGMQNDIGYEGRADQMTLAQDVKSK